MNLQFYQKSGTFALVISTMSEKFSKPKLSFKHFLSFFPEVELPLILSEESSRVFSQENDPLPGDVIEHFIQPFEEIAGDEFTEYVPCARIPDTYDFHAVIVWRAGLMDYQFLMFCFSKDGSILLDRKTLAGTYSDGKVLVRSVATVDEDWQILVVTGQSALEEDAAYDASTSKAVNLELLPEGRIVQTD